MENRDVLIRFFTPMFNKRDVPRDLLDQMGTDATFPSRSLEVGSDDTGVALIGERVFENLRNARVAELIVDLKRHSYVLDRVHLHDVETAHGAMLRFTIGFTHVSKLMIPYECGDVLGWCMNRLVANGEEVLAGEGGSLTVPKEEADPRHAVLVHIFKPRKVSGGAPVFRLRFTGRSFWIQDPEDPEGNTSLSVDQANALAARHTAREEAKSKAGAAAKSALKSGETVSASRFSALQAAREVLLAVVRKCDTTGLYDDEQYASAKAEAEATAIEIANDLNWVKYLKKYARRDAD